MRSFLSSIRRSWATVGGAVVVGVLLYALSSFLLSRANRGPTEGMHLSTIDAPEASFQLPDRPEFDGADDQSADSIRVRMLREESFDIAERLVVSLPDSLHALCLLGTVHSRHANQEEAIRIWQHCLDRVPRFADAHYSLGMAALDAGDNRKAEQHLSRAFEIDPNWEEVPVPLAKACMRQRKFTRAIELLENFLPADANPVDGWSLLGRVYHQSKDFRNAKRCYLQAVRIDPSNSGAHYGAAVAMQHLGENEQAEEHFQRFRKIKAKDDQEVVRRRSTMTDSTFTRISLVNTHMTAARIYSLRGMPTAAERHWRKAASLDPGHFESRMKLLKLFESQQRYSQAAKVAAKLCEINPDDPSLWFKLGTMCVHAGNVGEAEVPYRRVIELAPDQPEGYAALAQVRMLPGGDISESLTLANKAVDLAPTAPNFFVLASVQLEAGDRSAALASMRRAKQLAPGERRYEDGYARLLQGL